jgi:hypothetical protein
MFNSIISSSGRVGMSPNALGSSQLKRVHVMLFNKGVLMFKVSKLCPWYSNEMSLRQSSELRFISILLLPDTT